VSTGGWRGPGWRVVDAHSGHVKPVRDWISAAITRHGCPVDPADAALAVSELFTNAVMHGPAGGRVLVGYCLWPLGARIVVCDGGGSGTPELRPVTGQAEGGRGLHVVDSVTARWGSFRLAGNLVTWCDLGQPLRAPASDAWAWLHCVLSAGAHLPVPAWQRAGQESGPASTGTLVTERIRAAPMRSWNQPGAGTQRVVPARRIARGHDVRPGSRAAGGSHPGRPGHA